MKIIKHIYLLWIMLRVKILAKKINKLDKKHMKLMDILYNEYAEKKIEEI